MDLQEMRKSIDTIDEEILGLFVKRMAVSRDIAQFKKENKMPILQSNREEEVIRRIRSLSPDDLAEGASVLFMNIMDIGKSVQQQAVATPFPLDPLPFLPEKACRVGCQGVTGSYQEQACKKLFGDKPLTFYPSFNGVFKAVDNGELDYGILPIINSTAGSVTETYDLMRKYEFYITARVQVEISHCLAVRPGVAFEKITHVLSHEQALSQCSDFLRDSKLPKTACLNTALAAQEVRDSGAPIAAICSEECARLYGLHVLRSNIANVWPNYTKFICISKKLQIPENPGTISVSLSIPNVKGSLYRLLTKFFVNNLDLEHIESKPIANGSFDALFYLDFSGDVRQKNVSSLLGELKNELPTFKFLGNYGDIL